jgi:HTH-type transcriptional regulator / antitoxin HipB
MDSNTIRNVKNLEKLLDSKYGPTGTEKREKFEELAQYFVIGEMLKEARKEVKLNENNRII